MSGSKLLEVTDTSRQLSLLSRCRFPLGRVGLPYGRKKLVAEFGPLCQRAL